MYLRVTARKNKDGSKAWDENDRSLCFVLEYGSFRYFHGGDIAGDGGLAGGNTDPQSQMGTTAVTS